jgi:hypothetical protein
VNVARDLQDELKNDLQSHRSNGRWELVLRLRPKVKAAIKSVEATKLPLKKSTASSLKCQESVYIFFLWDSAQEICSSTANNKSAVLLECVETIAWEPATKTSRKVAEWGLVLATWQSSRPHSRMSYVSTTSVYARSRPHTWADKHINKWGCPAWKRANVVVSRPEVVFGGIVVT